MCRNKWPRKPSGSTLPNRHTSRSRSRANDQASEFSPNDVLKHFPNQRQVRDDLLQPTVLGFQCPQSAHLVGQQAAILLLPIEIRRLANSCLPADPGDRCPSLARLEDEGLLRLSELRCFQAISLLSQPGKQKARAISRSLPPQSSPPPPRFACQAHEHGRFGREWCGARGLPRAGRVAPPYRSHRPF